MIDAITLCLAMTAFREARAEPKIGQYAVMEVVHNRSKSDKFPNGYCNVVKQKNQFSWYRNHNSLKIPNYEIKSWNTSVEIAKDFQRKRTNYTKGALFFNHKSLGVRYRTNIPVTRIGNHVFY